MTLEAQCPFPRPLNIPSPCPKPRRGPDDPVGLGDANFLAICAEGNPPPLTMAFSSLKRFSPLALVSSSPGQCRWCGDTNSNRLFFLGGEKEGKQSAGFKSVISTPKLRGRHGLGPRKCAAWGQGQDLEGVRSLSMLSGLAFEVPAPMHPCFPNV